MLTLDFQLIVTKILSVLYNNIYIQMYIHDIYTVFNQCLKFYIVIMIIYLIFFRQPQKIEQTIL